MKTKRGANGPHQFYRFSGSYFEIGFQHGQALREEIAREANSHLALLCQKRRISATTMFDHVLRCFEPLFQKHAPSALEEIKGIAAGAGLSYAHAFFAATRDGMKVPPKNQQACTSISCGRSTTVGGRVFIAQTKDTAAPLERYRIMRYTHSSGRRMVLLNYPGWIANLGMTSDGVGFVSNSLYARGTRRDTVPFSLVKRIILEKKTVQEVLDVIGGFIVGNCCMQIADRTGHQVCIECAAGRLRVRDVSGQAFGHANSVLVPELKKLECKTLGSPSSPIRQENIDRLLAEAQGKITGKRLQRILSDHGDYPLSICRHSSPADRLLTTAGVVCNLTDLEVDIAIGNPCVAPFVKYKLSDDGSHG